MVKKLVSFLKRYQEGELSAILNEKRSGRRRPYLTVEKEQDFLKEPFERALDGEFITIQELFDADQKRVGRKTTRQGFYAFLKRHR